jgi:hypothetical protein
VSGAETLALEDHRLVNVPDGQDTAGLGEASLLLNTADPLLEDGGYLGRGGLRVGGVCASLKGGNGRCGISL